MISTVFNNARKKIEGQIRKVPFSKEKEKKRGMLMYQKAKVKQLKGGFVDAKNMEKRKQLYEIIDEKIESISQAKNQVVKAKEEWDKIVENRKEIREKELLDFYNKFLDPKDSENQKEQKRIIRGIQKTLQKQHDFQYMTVNLGKGE